MTSDAARETLVAIKRMKDQIEAAEENVKQNIRRGLVVLNEDGTKRYDAIRCKGREKVSVTLLRERYPDIAAEVTTRGSDYDRMTWRNQ